MVISGGDFKPDALKTKEMVSLLLDDDEMKSRCKYNYRARCNNYNIVYCITYVCSMYVLCTRERAVVSQGFTL